MFYKRRLKPVFVIVLITILWSLAWAQDSNQSESMALRQIMQEMGDHMEVVTAAIAREQWSQVVAMAPLIGEHRQPPFMEKTRILRFAGTDVGTFRSFDNKTQGAAETLKQAALENNGEKVIEAFARLQKTCLNCHQRFREPFVAHFYKK